MKGDRKAHPANAPGDWYVDRRCIDCGASESLAPELFVRREGQAVFARQPQSPDEERAAWRAALACPTASVRRRSGGTAPADAIPQALAPGVWRCGYNAKASYGAHSYFVARTTGNVLIDSPRWTRHVVDFLAAQGGLAHLFLTHRDDVADAAKYAKAFDAEVWIHRRDVDGAPFAAHTFRGNAVTEPLAGWRAVPVPGHTAGSVAYLLEDTFLFTGDSLAWDVRARRLVAFRDACWYSWTEQARSLARLGELDFEWVLAGHGGSVNLPPPAMRKQLHALVDRMRRSDA